MISLPRDRMNQLVKRFDMLEAQMAAGPDPEAYVKLASEYSELQDIAARIRDLFRAESELADLEAMLADKGTDAEMRALAEADLPAVEAAHREPASRISRSCCCPRTRRTRRTPSSKSAPAPAATRRRCSPAICSACTSAMPRARAGGRGRLGKRRRRRRLQGNHRQRSSGKGVFAKLKFESGVHRVQRVPATEAQGRIHTSAATVAVLPEAEEVDIEIRAEDIRIDTMRASGAGGQHVNTTDSAVRITHLPTGIWWSQAGEVAAPEPGQGHADPARAALRHGAPARRRANAPQSRKRQVGSGDRSERIRTYNFPQGRLTDHRINLTLYKLDRVMMGELDEVDRRADRRPPVASCSPHVGE